MSHFWHRYPSTERQTLSYLIIAAHVFTRALPAGSALGVVLGTLIHLLRPLFNPTTTTTTTTTTSQHQPTFSYHILRSSATGASIALMLMAFGLIARMWGRADIEWKTRAWRLLGNEGQMEFDNWVYGGMAAGLGASFVFGDDEEVFGWMAVGSLVGVLGFGVKTWRN